MYENDNRNTKNKRRNQLNDSPIENDSFIEWSTEQENLLVEWCDIAQCYKWLNSSSHRTYTKLHDWYTIPTIILSTLTGTASFAQLSFPFGVINYSPYIIGSVTIFVGVLTTIQQYQKITEFKENYRISAILWDKYQRNIRIELARAPDERMDARNFLKLCRNELDHLMETTPLITQRTIKKFKIKFKGEVGTPERKIYDDLKKPDILGAIISAETNRHHWFKNDEMMDNNRRKSVTLSSPKHKLTISENTLRFQDGFDEIPVETYDIETGYQERNIPIDNAFFVEE
jgi:hypothetical protein